MNEKISKNDLKNLIKLGYDLDLIVLEFDVPLNILEEYKKELEVPSEEKETSKEIKRLIKSRKFDDALKYTDKYPDNPVIQSQKVNIYIKKRKYREAKEIGKKFENYAQIQSQMATIAIQEGDYEKAKEIGEKFRDNAPIQSQMAIIAIKQGDYEKAREIGKKFENYAPIQSQMVTIATKQGDYEKAKEIGKKFENYAPIQSQMVTIAIKERDYEKAKEIGKKFLNDEVIQLQIEKIEKKMKDENNEEIKKEYIMEQLKEYNPFCKECKEKVELLNQIKTKLYYELEKIDLQEILQNKELTEKQKLYVALAINEKRKNVKNIKELASKYKDSDEIKNINIILQRTQSKKKKIFDWGIYDVCLEWELDENLKNKYEQNKKKQKENGITQREEKLRTQKHKEEEQQEERKKQNKVREQIIKENYNVHTNKKISDNNIQKPKVQQFFKSELKNEEQHKNNNDFKNELKVQVQQDTTKIKQQNEEKQQKHIYTEVMEYLIEKRKPIYVKMQSTDLETQREGISQWDKLDDLIEKTKELKENEDYMKNIYERVTRLKEKEENQIRR